MELVAASGCHYAKITPPQTNDIPNFEAGKGAYCFVIDVSGSMNAAAQITTDDGDKVNHGWSQLDIAKHSTNTFISSLGDDDFICVVTYSDGANVRRRARTLASRDHGSCRTLLWPSISPPPRPRPRGP